MSLSAKLKKSSELMEAINETLTLQEKLRDRTTELLNAREELINHAEDLINKHRKLFDDI